VLVDLLKLDQLAVSASLRKASPWPRAALVGVGLEAVDLAADLHDFLGVSHVVEEIDRRLDLLVQATQISPGASPRRESCGCRRGIRFAIRLHEVEDVVHACDELVDLVRSMA